VNRYADRLDPQTYSHEEPVALGMASEAPDTWLFVPETVFARLLALGRAYQLHLLGQVLRESQEARLNPLQCAELLDEIAFVAALVSDPVLAAWLPRVEARIAACARSRTGELILDLEQ
jgi:hypothetical protein